jgi:hypothetical protein
VGKEQEQGASSQGEDRATAVEPVPVSPLRDDIPSAVWTTEGTVAGHLAMWAVRQSPYRATEALTEAITQFREAFPGPVAGLSQWADEDELHGAIWNAIEASPAIIAWNCPKSGHEAPFVFSSRYDRPSPDDDFIDLHALARNIARSVWAEEVANA